MKTTPDPHSVLAGPDCPPPAPNASSAIGVFDSGVGGLTVAAAIAKRLPHESILYFGDTQRCPYGPRDPLEVRGFVRQICTWFSSRDVKLIVIACNTATAAGLTMAQREFDVPVLGVIVPGARAATAVTVSRRVGVIGTVATIESRAYTKAIHALDAGITVFSAATPRFVEIVEEGLRLDNDAWESITADAASVYIRPAFSRIARDYLVPLKRCKIDTLVLGCTHFPLLAPLIGGIMGPDVTLISSADETANDVAETLSRRGQLAGDGAQAVYRYATTAGSAEEFSSLASHIVGHAIEVPERVGVDELERITPSKHHRMSR